jgi:CoA:oxalate CoA-transferase
VIGRPEFLADPRFATDASRTIHESVLRDAFESWASRLSSEEVVAALAKAGVPAAPIASIGDAVDSRHAAERGLFRNGQLEGGDMMLPEQPVHFSTFERGQPVRVPHLDEHAAQLRAWLGETA